MQHFCCCVTCECVCVFLLHWGLVRGGRKDVVFHEHSFAFPLSTSTTRSLSALCCSDERRTHIQKNAHTHIHDLLLLFIFASNIEKGRKYATQKEHEKNKLTHPVCVDKANIYTVHVRSHVQFVHVQTYRDKSCVRIGTINKSIMGDGAADVRIERSVTKKRNMLIGLEFVCGVQCTRRRQRRQRKRNDFVRFSHWCVGADDDKLMEIARSVALPHIPHSL